jgi:hypothetical protein
MASFHTSSLAKFLAFASRISLTSSYNRNSYFQRRFTTEIRIPPLTIETANSAYP